jgi:flagellar protein FliT
VGTVQALYHCTERFYDHLHAWGSTKDDREAYIKKIERFLDEREQLIDNLPSTYSAEEKALGLKIVDYNKEIDKKLQITFQSVKQEIGNIKRQKVSNRRYANPYEGFSADGMFLDQRK